MLDRIGFLVVAACAGATAASAQEIAKREPWTIVLMLENDTLARYTDRHYTNGIYAAATSGAKHDCGFCADIADATMLPELGASTYRYGFFLGQSMFTPEDLLLTVPDPNDRPYAGWLFAGGRVYRETDNVLDKFEVAAGLVGPGSGADAVQRWWHAMTFIGGVTPHGWHAQIKDEPGIVVSEQRTWRMRWTEKDAPIGVELLPEANVSLGNVFTYAGVGANLRAGQGLDADWGLPRIAPALTGADFIDFNKLDGFAWNVFVGFEARAVARNITLDGNSFQHSASVDKFPFVADFNMGAAIIAFEKIRASLSYTLRSREFHTQNGLDDFVSLALSYSF